MGRLLPTPFEAAPDKGRRAYFEAFLRYSKFLLRISLSGLSSRLEGVN
jgi:hypothetical protein